MNLVSNWQGKFHMIGVETLFDFSDHPIGLKRQNMITAAKGRYVVFIDADDEVPENYLTEIVNALRSRPDAIGFKGYMTTNGKNRQDFWISKILPYVSTAEYHFRHTNHLAPCKRSIALQIGYKPLSYGEDYDYAVRLKESGLIKTEIFIDQELYHYKYVKK